MTDGERESRTSPSGLRGQKGGRRAAARLGAALLLAFGPPVAGLGASPAPASAATVRVESAWTGPVGTGGANGKATVRAFDTGAGSIALALVRLAPSTGYAVAIRRGTCAAPGTRIVAAGTARTTASGALATTRSLTAAQVAAVRAAASGTSRISVRVGSGAAPAAPRWRSRCRSPRRSGSPRCRRCRSARAARTSARPTSGPSSMPAPRGRGWPGGRTSSSSTASGSAGRRRTPSSGGWSPPSRPGTSRSPSKPGR